MGLPKISFPIITETLFGKEYNIRAYRVGEQKIILNAMQSITDTDSDEEISKKMKTAIMQMVNQCVVDEDFDIDTVPYYVVEYLIIQLRKISESNKISVTFTKTNENSEETLEVVKEVDLGDVLVEKPKSEKELQILLDEENNIGVQLKYPNYSVYTDILNNEIDPNNNISLYVESIFTPDEVFTTTDLSSEEIEEWLENNLSLEDYNKIVNLMGVDNLPTVYKELEIQFSPESEKETVKLRSLQDFFF